MGIVALCLEREIEGPVEEGECCVLVGLCVEVSVDGGYPSVESVVDVDGDTSPALRRRWWQGLELTAKEEQAALDRHADEELERHDAAMEERAEQRAEVRTERGWL